MERILEFIKAKNIFKPNAKVGVGVSGGVDSMSLLHFLNTHKEELNITVIAVNVNHCTRKEDVDEANFVEKYCTKYNIPFIKEVANAAALKKTSKLSMEEACREVRFGVFEDLREKGKIDYIALAHHQRDQAETILMHIVRGSGLKGASGMTLIKDDFIVRPFLTLPKEYIEKYVIDNKIPFMQDFSNHDINISRNFVRLEILPKLRSVWPNVEAAIFGRFCREDDELIQSYLDFNAVVYEKDLVKLPRNYFVYPKALVYRLIDKALSHLKASQNFERKHFDSILKLSRKPNGSRINLPNKIVAYAEYDYITLCRHGKKLEKLEKPFQLGLTQFGHLGNIEISEIENPLIENGLMCDKDKIPSTAVWRTRKEGDYIVKFGGGTRKLKNYFVDKKIPIRIRDTIPVLANNDEILIVLGVDISDNVKIDDKTKHIYRVRMQESE